MTQSDLIPVERIEKAIYFIRGEKVILDRDLAALYGVETKVLKQSVRRNIERFPEDFMFVLNATEFRVWRSQFVTSKADRKGLRYALHDRPHVSGAEPVSGTSSVSTTMPCSLITLPLKLIERQPPLEAVLQSRSLPSFRI